MHWVHTESKCVKTIIRLNLCDVCWRTLSYEKETSDSKIKENIYISSIPAHGGLIQVITYANNKGIIDNHDLYLLFNASNTSQIVRDDWWLLSDRQTDGRSSFILRITIWVVSNPFRLSDGKCSYIPLPTREKVNLKFELNFCNSERTHILHYYI